MPKPPKDRVDPTRRALLRRIGLGAGMVYVAPSLTGLAVARASGGSGGGGSGPSGPEAGARNRPAPDQPRRVQRAAPARQPAPRRASAAAPRPEIVALIPAGTPLDAAIAAGYCVLAQRETDALPGQIARFALPNGRSLADARAELSALFPDALTDENHVYTPDSFLCSGADCAAQAMIGWSGWPSAMRPRLGMIDTGVNTAHPALAGRRLQVFQVDLGERDAAGRQHGTAIAAMLVGSVEGRVPGLLPDAELIAVEAFHARAGAEQADVFSLVNAFDILIREGADVINLSFSGPANAVLERMIQRAHEAGIALVAAAGNGGPGASPAYPAAWPQVIAVTAVDADERAYRQANQGPYVMLAAPGVNVWAAASISGGKLRTGTSYAAPFVTAALAVERMRSPGKTTQEATETLFACARDLGETGFDPVFGHGLVSAPGQCVGNAGVFSVSGE